jgi:hypothetical protein
MPVRQRTRLAARSPHSSSTNEGGNSRHRLSSGPNYDVRGATCFPYLWKRPGRNSMQGPTLWELTDFPPPLLAARAKRVKHLRMTTCSADSSRLLLQL